MTTRRPQDRSPFAGSDRHLFRHAGDRAQVDGKAKEGAKLTMIRPDDRSTEADSRAVKGMAGSV